MPPDLHSEGKALPGRPWAKHHWIGNVRLLALASTVLGILVLIVVIVAPIEASKHHRSSTSSASSQNSGSPAGISTGTSAVIFPHLPPLAANAHTEITVGSTQIGSSLSSGFAGLSYEKVRLESPLFQPDNAPLVALFRLLGPSLLRIGGNTVDTRLWNASGPGLTSPYISPPDVDRLAGFLNATGWKALYGVRMVSSNPTIAADEAVYAAKALGSSLYGFEIGNEPNGYAMNPGVNNPHFNVTTLINGDDTFYGWNDYATAIQAQLPGALLTGPACSSDTVSTFAVPFAVAEAKNIRRLTHHYYRNRPDAPDATASTLLAADPWLSLNGPLLYRTASTNNITEGARFTESNSYSAGGAQNISNAYTSSLWVIRFLFTLAEMGITGADFHGGGPNGYYSPIYDAGTMQGKDYGVSPRPIYHGILSFQQVARGALLATNTNDTVGGADAWITKDVDGSVRAMLLNSNVNSTVKFTLNWPSAMVGSNGTAILLQASALTALTNVTLGGAAVGNDGSWTPTSFYTVDVKNGQTAVTLGPIQAAVIKFELPT